MGLDQDRRWAQLLIDQGDEWAFRQLYRRHSPRLYQYVLRLLGRSSQEAEDIVQETWIRAVSGLPRFRWQAAFSTWLMGIGLNLCRERLRRSLRERSDSLEVVPTPCAIPRPPGLRMDLEKAISLLPDGYRLVLVLHDVEGRTHREIASDLGISEGTSKSQLFNARKVVRAWLRSDAEDEYEQRKATS